MKWSKQNGCTDLIYSSGQTCCPLFSLLTLCNRIDMKWTYLFYDWQILLSEVNTNIHVCIRYEISKPLK